jgi:hypothetical protein
MTQLRISTDFPRGTIEAVSQLVEQADAALRALGGADVVHAQMILCVPKISSGDDFDFGW